MTVDALIAYRYLRGKRREAFISIITVISVLGVAVSVMVLDIVLAIMTGFEAELQKKLVDTSAPILVRRYGGELDRWKELRENILTIPGVTGVVPYSYSQVLLSTASGARGLIVRGVSDLPEAKERLAQALSPSTSIEDLFQPPPYRVIRPDGAEDDVRLPPLVVGEALARQLGLSQGEPIMLLTPQLTGSPQGLMPKFRRFLVVGTYSSGLMEYEGALAYTTLNAAQSFFALGGGVTGLEVLVERLEDTPQLTGQIGTAINTEDVLYDVTDWTVQNKDLWEAIRLEKRVYFIVLLLLILVASFSIVSTLVMIVMEKAKDIAILKTMGASDRLVLRVFLLQGILIGTVGTLLGTLLGVLGGVALRKYGFPINRNVFSLDSVPVYLIPSNFISVAVAALVITSLAGIYPARRAARLRPADALRFE